jgi:hypothetical protein
MENKLSTIMAVVGGTLTAIAGILGSVGLFGTFLSVLSEYVSEDIAIYLNGILTAVTYIALFGGISIVIGGILIGYGHKRSGKIVISFGLGFGIIGFIFGYIMMLVNNAFDASAELLKMQSMGWIGQVLSLFSLFTVSQKSKDEKKL